MALWGRLFGLIFLLALLCGAVGVVDLIVRGVDAGTIALIAAAVIPAAIALAALISAPIAVVWLLAARLLQLSTADAVRGPARQPCPRCGYDLTGLTEQPVCPECGDEQSKEDSSR